ncbi:hypothetical protein CDD82_2024 [Ophiocordyceps australis]|uniref:Zn(2)-C6 fungal-type domain-containing protein n=1 Tax=Ophiocordyceps australis TaxID=1399860 RepID=A0A2C5Y3L1_9HYPO|nr:hypothetical protein CDD82_2024 [Ophiocordyceps australis]
MNGGTSLPGRPRKFVIQSTFGSARERRSRKNRPCDACRRRKTACVITSEPPCHFCQSRGIVCQSTPAAWPPLNPHPDNPSHHPPAEPPNEPPHDLLHDHLLHDQLLHNHQLHDQLPTPSTTAHESPKLPEPLAPRSTQIQPHHHSHHHAHRLSTYSQAAAVHQTLVAYADDCHCHSPSLLDPARPSSPHPASAPVPTPDPPEPPPPSSRSLEDIVGRTAYYMGATSEQDTFLLDAFRYGILSEKYNLDANIVQVQPGTSLPDHRPVHFLLLEIGHPDHVNRARQAASDAIEAKVWPYGENLVRLFFRHIHPVLPLVSKLRFLSRYAADKKSLPACLRGALYALASVFWPYDPALRGTPCPFHQHDLVDHAHAALRREIENPNLFVLQACLLLIHVTPPAIDSMEAPTTWTLAAQATACAQVIGLHQDPGHWHIDPVEKRLRRKLWWATFITDCWSSICHGNPPHISHASFNTCPLTMDDLRADEDVPDHLRHLVELPDTVFDVSTGARFSEMVNIARHLRAVLDCSFQVNTRAISAAQRLQSHAQLATVQAKLRDWPSLLPSCLVIQQEERKRSNMTCYNCPLHLSFYAAQVLLYRALMYPPTREAKTTPGSNLRTWFPAALTEFESFVNFLGCVNKHDLFGFWGRHARSQLILCGNFIIYLFLLASDRGDIERAYRLLEAFHQSVHELGDSDHVQVKTLLRAATIRIDSFFTQAAQIMRNGGNETATSILNS